MISEEKWSEGTNWSDLVREGEEREQVCLIEEESRIQEEMVNTDKAMRIMVPGTEAIKPAVQLSPLPAGLIKRIYGPRQGGQIF